MRCPRCDSRLLRVEVTFTGFVNCRFSDNEDFELTDPVSLDSDWDDSARCECRRCDWSGYVADARSSGPDSSGGFADGGGRSVSAPARIGSLQDVKEQLKLGCDESVARECIEFLVTEVERLGALLETIQRVAAKEQEGGNYGDTSMM